jgi:hypothetical protein
MLLTALALGAAAPLRLPPIDECAKDHSFVQFRSELRNAVEHRDTEGLQRAGFDSHFRPGASFWNELGKRLRLGCVMRHDYAMVPSIDYQLIDRNLDEYTTLVARPGALLRSRPSKRARIVARLNWHVLLEPEDAGGDWTSVRLTDGRKGYLHSGQSYGAMGYRFRFEKREGHWALFSAGSGD